MYVGYANDKNLCLKEDSLQQWVLTCNLLNKHIKKITPFLEAHLE